MVNKIKELMKNHKILIILLLFGLVLRLLLFIYGSSDVSKFTEPDSRDYLTLTDNLLQKGAYTTGDEPEIFRAPGYSFFMAGIRSLLAGRIIPVVLLQILLDCISCFMVYLLAAMIFKNKKIQNIALAFQILSLPAIVYSSKILSETLFTFLFLILLLLCEYIKYIESNNIKKITISAIIGLVLGITCLTRAILLPMIPLFILYLCFNTNWSWKPTAIAILVLIITITPWCIRNKIMTDYSGISTVSSINMYRYNACALMARDNNIAFFEQMSHCDIELAKHSTQKEKAEFAMYEGKKKILSSPLKYTFLHLKSDIRNFLPAYGDLVPFFGYSIGGKGTLNVIQSHGIIAGVKYYFNGNWGLFIMSIPFTILLIVKYITFSLGAINLNIKHFSPTFIFYMLLLSYFLLVPGPASLPRFRIPVDPIFAIFAAYGIHVFLHKICMTNKV